MCQCKSFSPVPHVTCIVGHLCPGAGLEESNDSGSDAVEGGESGGDGSREYGTRKTRRKRRKQYV